MDFKRAGSIHRYILLILLIHENSISMYQYVYRAFVDSNEMCVPHINHWLIPEITLKGADKLALTFFFFI